MDNVGDRSVAHLSDEELLARLREHVGKGHVWQAQLIAHLVEVEERRLERLHACSSMWDFCTRKLGMSESEAQRRITATRIVRRFPQVLGYLERGALHLCGLYALRDLMRHRTPSGDLEAILDASLALLLAKLEKERLGKTSRQCKPTTVEVHPRALGGSDDAANLRVRCRAHNALYAEQIFGREHVEARIHLQRRKCTPPALPSPSIQTAARALCG